MLWCPKCNVEYRDDCKTCGDCGSELTDKPEHMAKVSEPQYDREAFLVSVGDSIEADMLEALLNANRIPVLKKYREAGDYLKIYMGGTNFGVDLYVPSQILGKAQEIVANNQGTFDGDLQDGDVELQGDWQQDTDEVQQDDGQQYTDEAQRNEDSRDAENEDATRAENTFSRKRRFRTWIILLFFIPGLIWIIYALISTLYQWLAGR